MHRFFKGILILIACLIIAALSALFFQTFGDYAFLIMIVITLLALMQRVKPKFGNKDKEE
jgi:uncharacterized membrane protein YgaE (UPF0421/DUF939 family)